MNFKDFVTEYRGAIIGAAIAVIVILTGLYRLVVGILLVCVGIFVGNYVQKNKDEVKEKLKNFIDRL